MDVLRIHPNGRVVASYDRRKVSLSDLLPHDYPRGFRDAWGVPSEIIRAEQIADARARGVGGHGPLPLGLSSIPKSVTPRKIRGSGGITPEGRQRVKDAATLLEEAAPKGTMVLWTVTVPPGLERATAKIWARITDNLRNQIRKDLRKAGLPGDIVFVSEYQEERERKYGIPVLHLHFMFQGAHHSGRWKYSCEHYRERWEQCIRNACGNSADDVTWVASSRIEKVRKSCSSYIGKYLSKGVSIGDGGGDDRGNPTHPRAWYGIGKDLRKRVMSRIRRLRGPVASRAIHFLLGSAATLCRFSRWVSFVGRDGRTRYIAWYADLLDPGLLGPLTDQL